MNPRIVSVIMPAFNAAATIRSAIESVLAQAWRELELIVVDDGSTDETAQIVSEIAARDSRVHLLKQANSGVAAARNNGIREARGEFIAPIDADDIWFPEKIEKQIRAFAESDLRVGLVYAWSVFLDRDGAIIDGCPIWEVEGEVYRALLYRNFIGNASVPLIRRSVLNEIGGYDESMRAAGAQGCEDWDICLRIAERYEFRVVREYLVGYRIAAGSMSSDYTSMARGHALLLRRARERHPEIPRRVFRWSAGHFHLYLALKSFAERNAHGALEWLVGSLRLDPAILLSPRIYRIAFLAALQALTGFTFSTKTERETLHARG